MTPTTLVDSERVTPPTSAPVIIANGSNVDITWGAAADNVGVEGYNVYRRFDNGATSPLGTSASPSFTDSRLAPGDYGYYIGAVDAAGNVDHRTGFRTVTVTDGNPTDTERPVPARSVRWISIGTTNVRLAWDPGTANVGVVEYQIFDNVTRTEIARTTDTSITISGLTTGTTYSFFVKQPMPQGPRWR